MPVDPLPPTPVVLAPPAPVDPTATVDPTVLPVADPPLPPELVVPEPLEPVALDPLPPVPLVADVLAAGSAGPCVGVSPQPRSGVKNENGAAIPSAINDVFMESEPPVGTR
jgi:hypothetical protein